MSSRRSCEIHKYHFLVVDAYMLVFPAPTSLNAYRVREVSPSESGYDREGIEFFKFFELCCPCGCNEFDLIFSSHPSGVPDSPLKTKCAKCGSIKLFFDSKLHGYDAMLDALECLQKSHACEDTPKRNAEECLWTCPDCKKAGHLILWYEYHIDEDDVSTLPSKKVEDCFDGITVVHFCKDHKKSNIITWFECA